MVRSWGGGGGGGGGGWGVVFGGLVGGGGGVGGPAEDFVVVFCFGAFEADVGLLVEELDLRGGGVVFFGLVEGVQSGFEVFVVHLALGEGQEAVEGVRVDGEGFRAVGERLFHVVHLTVVSGIGRTGSEYSYLGVALAGHLYKVAVELVWGHWVYVARSFGRSDVLFDVLYQALLPATIYKKFGRAVELPFVLERDNLLHNLVELLLSPEQPTASFRVRIRTQAFPHLLDALVHIAY